MSAPSRSYLIPLTEARMLLGVSDNVLRVLLLTYGIQIQKKDGKEVVSGRDLRTIYDRARQT